MNEGPRDGLAAGSARSAGRPAFDRRRHHAASRRSSRQRAVGRSLTAGRRGRRNELTALIRRGIGQVRVPPMKTTGARRRLGELEL